MKKRVRGARTTWFPKCLHDVPLPSPLGECILRTFLGGYKSILEINFQTFADIIAE